MNLRLQNEIPQNDLNIEKKTYETMMKYKESMNQLNEQNHYRDKGKAGIGYT